MASRSLPEPLAGSFFHIRDAEAVGISRSALRSREVVAPYRGVRAPAQLELSDLDRCRVYLERMPPDHFFSHVTAARLWGMRLPWRLRGSRLLDVTAPLPLRAPRMRGVRGHHCGTGRIEVQPLHGVPVSSPVDTWRQLSTVLSVDELVVVGDGLVCRKAPLLSSNQLGRALARHGGRRGVVALRAAYAQVRPGTDSARETELRMLMVAGGLPEPRVNAIVSEAGATRLRYGDLVYPDWRVIVEYDGDHHRTDRQQFAQDVLRLEELTAAGWTIVRVLADHLVDPFLVVDRIRRALIANGWRP